MPWTIRLNRDDAMVFEANHAARDGESVWSHDAATVVFESHTEVACVELFDPEGELAAYRRFPRPFQMKPFDRLDITSLCELKREHDYARFALRL